jgi:UDP-N-acetylglucosamine/UDP-N-acetylgalactosamine diphosphorylase
MDALKSRLDKLDSVLRRYNQDHVADLLSSIDEECNLITQLENIDLEEVLTRLDTAKRHKLSYVEPAPLSKSFNSKNMSEEELQIIKSVGLRAIYEGKVCAVILSGGQGTRLGFDGPKGCYDIGLPSGKSIFQLHIEKMFKISQVASKAIATDGFVVDLAPVYIMTSFLNDDIIQNFFKKNNYFGYSVDKLFFFKQGLEPCLSFDGKLMVESKDSLAMAPDGNGGIYNALRNSGAVDDMKSRGIEHVHVYGIDNILTKSCDPVFLGLCIENEVEIGNKVVWRASKSEKVGVSVEVDGHMKILEYSEIPRYLADAEEASGKLR